MSGSASLLAGVVLAVAAWAWAMRAATDGGRVAVAVVLAALATAYNVVVPVPNVEATTTVVVCTVVVLGLRTGCLVGMLAVLGTGVTGGLGPWTAWQVVGTCVVALCAAAAGPLARAHPGGAGRLVLASCVACATIAYDVVVTVPSTLALGGSADAVRASLLLGLPYSFVHVLATTALTWALAPSLIAALDRARLRLGAGDPSLVPARR